MTGQRNPQIRIRYLEEHEKSACQVLWKEAFPEDSQEFSDYYFHKKIKNSRVLVLTEETPGKDQTAVLSDSIASMLHRNPYSLAVRGSLWNIDYIVGVATRRDRRHQGYMRRLLLRMMADMRKEQMPFCFLMPADEAIYRPFGFTYIFRQPHFILEKESSRLTVKKLISRTDTPDSKKLLFAAAEWMNQWLKTHYEVYSFRDESYLQMLTDEIASEDGTLDILYDGPRIAGMVSWWGRASKEQRLLYGDPPYIRNDPDKEKPAIMARIITLDSFMKAIRLSPSAAGPKPCIIPLRISDPLIPENNNTWLWHLSPDTSWLESEDSKAAVCEDKNLLPELSLKIEELTSWLFGYSVPEAAKPFDHLVEPLRRIFLDEVV